MQEAGEGFRMHCALWDNCENWVLMESGDQFGSTGFHGIFYCLVLVSCLWWDSLDPAGLEFALPP